MINVLVFPCGSEIGLEVHNALKFDKHIKLYGLSSVSCHAKEVYKNYIEGISFITYVNFLDELNKVIDENKIDVLIPAYDDVILFLSEHREEVHCRIVTSNKRTCDICRSKIKTYNYFKGEAFIPQTYGIDEWETFHYPLFAKPDIGQGSQGIMVLKSEEDVKKLLEVDEAYVISEMLPGKEYTVDCFTNSKGELIVASMRERKRIKTGISVNSVSYELPEEVYEIAKKLNSKIEFNGVWFFQVKLDVNNHYKLLEMAPRVAGSMSTSRIKGFNYILNSVYQTMGYEISVIPHLLGYVEVDRALSNKYNLNLNYNRVYIDFDDTITLGNIVNTSVIAFLYQCKNKEIRITLLTRHVKDIYASLKQYCIDSNLFDEIIHIEDETPKSNFVKEKKAIFIDDSFRERYEVSLNNEIPVFDVDCIEALMDWRV